MAASGISWANEVGVPAAQEFIKKRAKAELIAWMVDAFKKKLCEESKAERKTPRKAHRLAKKAGRAAASAATLDALSGSQLQLPGTILADVMRSDLEKLAGKHLITNSAEAQSLVFQLLGGLRRGQAPLGLLAGLSNHSDDTGCPTNTEPQSLTCHLSAMGTLIKLTGDAVRTSPIEFDDALPGYIKAFRKVAKSRLSYLSEAEAIQANRRKKLEVTSLDACLMATLKVAYALRESTDWLVASEDLEPAPG